ncbi:MAG: hypothetical protein WKF97_07750 [Chitinophagaceae bacterium]
MKKSTRHIFLLSTCLLCSTIMFSQENEKKPTAKEIAEKSAQADHIHAREVRKKQLKSTPEKIASPDTVNASPKKSALARKKKAKKKC